jgi:nitroimidazol reductase NimA-like FMN-containing flavoprotein (pyridoxamine 5'-phosphate oxidase superfamily)
MAVVATHAEPLATGFVALDRDECLRLLAGLQLGRLAVGQPGAPPLIRPVTYRFDEATQSVLFRSAEGSKLSALLRSQRVAFEVDGSDPVDGLGWSVIVTGPAEEVTGAADLAHAERVAPRVWVRGVPSHLMRIRALVVSGRRITRDR